jgi:uncharacterized membrane protein YeaQ/YmgE (transglycosylase-associated protein family)
MGEFFMPYPGMRINQDSTPLNANGMAGSASYYEVKFSDPAKPNGQIWTGVIGSPAAATPNAGPPQRWFVVWLGTSNDPVDKGAATALAESIQPWNPEHRPRGLPHRPRRQPRALQRHLRPRVHQHHLRPRVHQRQLRHQARPPPERSLLLLHQRHNGPCPPDRLPWVRRASAIRHPICYSDGVYRNHGPGSELGFASDCKETRMDIMAASEYLARSTTLTSVGWIGYIIIGAIAGWIAGKIVKGSGSGILMNIVIGIVGALIGGFLLSFFFDTAGGGFWFTLFTAILGSVILLWVVGKVRRT